MIFLKKFATAFNPTSTKPLEFKEVKVAEINNAKIKDKQLGQ